MITIMSASLTRTLSELVERERTLDPNETLFRTGDPVLSLFLVTTGALQLIRTLPHGSPLAMQRATAGAILAEASLFAERYHCDAVATEASVVGVLPLHRIEAAFDNDPAFARALARHLAHEVQQTRALAEILSMKTVAERADAWIALHSNELPPRGTWRQMASEIGVTPEALYRELARRRRL